MTVNLSSGRLREATEDIIQTNRTSILFLRSSNKESIKLTIKSRRARSQRRQQQALTRKMLREARSQLMKHLLWTGSGVLTPPTKMREQTSAKHDAHTVCTKRICVMSGLHVRNLVASARHRAQVHRARLLLEANLLLTISARSTPRYLFLLVMRMQPHSVCVLED